MAGGEDHPLSGSRILVVEDETHLARGIAENLEAEGFEVSTVADGPAGLSTMLLQDFDLVILDVMLPELDGFAVCEQARQRGCETPVLFLTARGDVGDRIRGLDAGGDDYLAKPFHLEEFLLRVRAILRRRTWYRKATAEVAVLRFGGNKIDFQAFRARSADGTLHPLTHKEAMILKTLAEREGQVVTREEMLDRVWGYDAYPSTRTIDNFVLRLRKRFEPDPEAPRHLHTVRGVGYRFTRTAE